MTILLKSKDSAQSSLLNQFFGTNRVPLILPEFCHVDLSALNVGSQELLLRRLVSELVEAHKLQRLTTPPPTVADVEAALNKIKLSVALKSGSLILDDLRDFSGEVASLLRFTP